MRALPLAALSALAAAQQPPPAPAAFGFGRTIGGAISDWVLGPGVELEAWNHSVSTAAGREHGAYLNHFWSAGGKGAAGQYTADRQIIRYYIDGEAEPSIEFEPAMAAGSGIGWEGLDYYNRGLNGKEPWGPEMSNSMMGHSAQTGGGWHNRFKIPFARSIRITVKLPAGIPSNFSSKMFLIFRGVEGDPRPLTVGSLSLPPTVPWSLRLRKFQTRVSKVQPEQFVPFVNFSSATQGADSGGALFLSVFVIKPFGGSLEGCFRAYTERSGPASGWPGLLLSTGTEDYYDSAYYFNHEARTFYAADAGLSHMSLDSTLLDRSHGDLPNAASRTEHPAAAGDKPRAGPRSVPPQATAWGVERSRGRKEGGLASMYRLHHNDPLYFRGKFELLWRDGGELVSGSIGRKCLVRSPATPGSTPIGGGQVDLTVDSWIYSWEQPAGSHEQAEP